jgi:hypothetical protein
MNNDPLNKFAEFLNQRTKYLNECLNEEFSEQFKAIFNNSSSRDYIIGRLSKMSDSDIDPTYNIRLMRTKLMSNCLENLNELEQRMVLAKIPELAVIKYSCLIGNTIENMLNEIFGQFISVMFNKRRDKLYLTDIEFSSSFFYTMSEFIKSKVDEKTEQINIAARKTPLKDMSLTGYLNFVNSLEDKKLKPDDGCVSFFLLLVKMFQKAYYLDYEEVFEPDAKETKAIKYLLNYF